MRICKARFQPAELDLRAGLDGALCSDRHRRLARLAARSAGLADDAVVGAARAQFPVVADLLCRPPHRPRARDRASASRRHPAFIAASWRLDRVAALLFAPYAVWVAFASVLNASILMLN